MSLKKNTFSAHLSGMQGSDEQQTEPYKQYGDGAAQSLTPQSAKSTSGVASSAREQTRVVRRKVGVFDSGVGGKSVVNAIKKALPTAEVLYRDDKTHVPYGTKPPAEILGYVTPILGDLVEGGCRVIVIACNTVSTTLITELRKNISVPLIATEPMVKPAAEQTKNGVIAVCATPTTLASARYKWLKDTYASRVKVLEPDCSDWSSMIETNHIDHQHIQSRIEACVDDGADVIVLGCTHYHWIEDLIKEITNGRATVLQPEQPVIEQLKRVL